MLVLCVNAIFYHLDYSISRKDTFKYHAGFFEQFTLSICGKSRFSKKFEKHNPMFSL